MKKLATISIIVFMLIKSQTLHCQTLTFLEGFRFEAGLGYNLAYLRSDGNPEQTIEESATTFNALYLTPTFRISYQIEDLEWLIFSPFLGYDVFGGLRKSDFSDELVGSLFYSIEAGLILSHQIKNFQLGMGTKVNSHLKIIQKYYNEETGEADESDITNYWFDKESIDLGFRLAYRINSFLILSDIWFSPGNLYDGTFESYGLHYKKYKFILLIGYQL